MRISRKKMFGGSVSNMRKRDVTLKDQERYLAKAFGMKQLPYRSRLRAYRDGEMFVFQIVIPSKELPMTREVA